MQEVFEKIIDRVQNLQKDKYVHTPIVYYGLDKAIEIVRKTATEYNNGWIPVSERLPEEAFGCLVTIIDTEPMTLTDFERILPYQVGYDSGSWNDADGNEIPFEVIAWQPLPEEYKI